MKKNLSFNGISNESMKKLKQQSQSSNNIQNKNIIPYKKITFTEKNNK